MRASLLSLCLLLASPARADEPIRLVREFSLSPAGDVIYFAWRHDIWSHPLNGGSAKRLTAHGARERSPRVSPDGETLAFVSDRTGTDQVYLMPAEGGVPEQVTFHSEGSLVTGWFPDGSALLVRGARDHFWRHAHRYFRKGLDGGAEELLFDSNGHSAALSPDGKRIAFCREGVDWFRKGYRGSQASQIWLFDRATRGFEKLTKHAAGERHPLWANGSLYFVSGQGGTFNLYRRDLASGDVTQLTHFEGDGVLFPQVSADGEVVVFRRGFDLYRLGDEPERLDLVYRGDVIHEPVRRAQLARASQVAFSDDGREIAFIAGGDLWVMDTELKEPKQVTNTPEEERDPVFAPDHESIVFVSDMGGRADLWSATRADPKRWWWQNDEFELARLTDDPEPEYEPRFAGGKRIAFLRLRGQLWTMKPDSSDRTMVLDAWNHPSYDFSPDGKWVAYAVDDADFNRDVWIRAADGSGEPVNVSRHPDWESGPAFSPDGKMLAFVGRRSHEEIDLFYVFLKKSDEEESKRDRTIEKAEKKMQGREKKKKPSKTPLQKFMEEWKRKRAEKEKEPEKAPRKKPPSIDLDGIADRIRRVSIPGADESAPFWSPDSKKLAFRAEIDGKKGLWTVEPPDELKPKRLSTVEGGPWRWLEEGDQVVGLVGGTPASLSNKGKATYFRFRAPQETDLPARHRAAFDQCWRLMRDRWYDPALNNRDWDAIGETYRGAAGAPTASELEQVVDMMLGELNGSHLGFSTREHETAPPPAWRDVTPHFGTRFDPDHPGPGLKVASVVPRSPASLEKSLIRPGEIIVSADGERLDPTRDLARQLNGPPDRDVRLVVSDDKGKERTVVIRPATYRRIRGLLYDEWQEKNRSYVSKRSDGKLGYLHVGRMNWSSFEKFEAELYKVGHGKDGLVIDVRENSGGFTADHLLTALCQPVHAITVARGGEPGYPQGRMVYARWHKPVVVLCNQNSFSNAEIFSHAIQTLERGPVVGVRTAGGVISTGGTSIMGFGWLRLPFRGWFVAKSGRDMELNGCVPDFEVWPRPEEWTRGTDRQLAKGVDVLAAEVAERAARPKKPLRYRSGGDAR